MFNYFNQKGQIALLITLVILGAILSIGAGLTLVTVKEMRMAKTVVESTQALFIADSGIELASYWMNLGWGPPPTGTCMAVGEGEFCLDTDEGVESAGTVKGKRRTIRIINNWVNLYGDTEDDVIARATRVDGSYSLVMDTTSYGHWAASGDFVVFEIDADGTPELGKAFGGPGNDYLSAGGEGEGGITGLSTGEYIITGTTNSYSADGEDDIFVMKLASDKSVIWQRVFGGIGIDRIQDEIITSSEIILVGQTTSFGAGKKDIILIRLDLDGIVQHAYTIGGVENDFGIHLDFANGGFIFAGVTASYGQGGTIDWRKPDILVIKFHNDFSIEWARTFGWFDQDDQMSTISIRPEGGYNIAGSNHTPGLIKALSLELDSNGNQEWATMCQVPGYNLTFFSGGENALEGGYFYTGNFKEELAAGDYDSFGLKMDNNGNQEWARSFSGAGDDFLVPEEKNYTLDRGYFLIGETDSWGAGGTDGLFIKISAGGLVYGCLPFSDVNISCNSAGDVPTVDVTGSIVLNDIFASLLSNNINFDTQDDVDINFSNICAGAGAKWIEIR